MLKRVITAIFILCIMFTTSAYAGDIVINAVADCTNGYHCWVDYFATTHHKGKSNGYCDTQKKVVKKCTKCYGYKETLGAWKINDHLTKPSCPRN